MLNGTALRCPWAHLPVCTFSELETFSKEACSLTELSFLSRNHLPSLPHVKELIKLPQTCLFSPEIASLLVSPLSFFDIFVRIIHLSCCCDIKKKCSWPRKMAYPPHPSFTSSFRKARSSLYSWCFSFLLPWSSFHLSSPFSLTRSTTCTQLTKGDRGAECMPPCPSNGPSFCSLSVAVHLAGCLFISSAYSAKACHLGRFQPSNSRKQSEGSVWKWRHVIDMLQIRGLCRVHESCASFSFIQAPK